MRAVSATALGFAGAVLLHLPVLASAIDFVRRKTEREECYGHFSPVDADRDLLVWRLRAP